MLYAVIEMEGGFEAWKENNLLWRAKVYVEIKSSKRW
jgi:hypothetical protein